MNLYLSLGIRCAAHTLQLALHDAFKYNLRIGIDSTTGIDNTLDENNEIENAGYVRSLNVNDVIEKVRNIVKKFRTPTYRFKLSEQNTKNFILDNSTR